MTDQQENLSVQPLPIKELIESKWYSSDLLLLKDEEPRDLASPLPGSTVPNTHHRKKMVYLQNSVSVALVLARAFVKYFDDISDRDGDCSHIIHLDDLFVTLGDFQTHVSFKNTTTAPLAICEDKYPLGKGKDSEETNRKKSARSRDKSKASVDDNLRVGFFSSFDNVGADAYEDIFHQAERERKRVIQEKRKAANARAAAIALARYKDEAGFELGLGYFSKKDDVSENLKIQDNIQSGKPQQRVPNLTDSVLTSNHKILLGLEIFSHAALDTSKLNDSRFPLDFDMKMRVLGSLLYSLFLNGSDPPFNIVPPDILNSTFRNEENGDIAHDDERGVYRQTKASRTQEGTVLAKLLESDAFPVSICQLLSDMIDIGPGGKANDPFKSFDDVVYDLEQMRTFPYVFLQDYPNHPGRAVCSPPIFGRQYYGRGKEIAQLLEVPTRLETICELKLFQTQSISTEAFFVSGKGGSGKSHLVNKCGDFLSTQGWLVVGEKFDRGLEYNSQDIVCSLFDKIVKQLITLKAGNLQDSEYSQRAAKALSESLDAARLCSLVEYLPSIRDLICDAEFYATPSYSIESNLSHWKLVYLLTRFINALLKIGRPMVLILDDLQWAEALAIDLVLGELLESIERQKNAHLFFFVGLYRDDEISVEHPLLAKLNSLRESSYVKITDMYLSAFSKDDLGDMVSNELKLPKRLVGELSDIVYKKTSGHILFAVELLNSMVRDSTIYFSMSRRQFHWKLDRVYSLKTDETVATFIVSTLSTLHPDALNTLRILSCCGFHTDVAILELLEESNISSCHGIRSSLQYLVDIGVVEIAGGLVAFAHDLIQQYVYENIDLSQRRDLHFNIALFLGLKTSMNSKSLQAMSSIDDGLNNLYISESKTAEGPVLSERSLLSIATDHINHTGPDFILELSQRKLFATWNLIVGKEMTARSNFGCALHYYEQGILFIGNGVWIEDGVISNHQLCLDLYEGASNASLATRNHSLVDYYTSVIFQNVPFERSIPAWITLMTSLESFGKHKEIVDKGIHLIRRLNIDVPPSPPGPRELVESMAATTRLASGFRVEQIRKVQPTDRHVRNIFQLFTRTIVATFSVSSPYLPCLSFLMMQYSLQNEFYGIETSVVMKQDYTGGKHWATVALEILNQAPPSSITVRVNWIIHGLVMVWSVALKETKRKLFDTYRLGMKIGAFSTSMYPLCFCSRIALLEGENLALLSQSGVLDLKMLAKYNRHCAKLVVLDMLMIDELRGVDTKPFSIFKDSIGNDDKDIMNNAQMNHDYYLLGYVYQRRFISAFWAGDYDSAEIYCRSMLSLPSAKAPTLQSIYITFYRGLIGFLRHRQSQSEEQYGIGLDSIVKFEFWLQFSPTNFENKLFLLQAENEASMLNVDKARSLYEASIKSASDNGRIHEKGLAYEFMGNFLSSVSNDPSGAKECMKLAHSCYLQWGAFGKAAILSIKHELNEADVPNTYPSLKHGRHE